MKHYRTNGAIGALLDEYERAVKELKKRIQSISPTELTDIVDNETTDEDCRSIEFQTIMYKHFIHKILVASN